MDSKLDEMLDQQRWLLNNGLVNDLAKNNLYLYGSIVHKDVRAVDMTIDVEKHVVSYTLFLDSRLFKRFSKFKSLSDSRSLLDLWKLKRILKKEGNLNFDMILSRFVRDFCGPSWSTKLNVVDFKNYKDGYEIDREQNGDDVRTDQQSDSR